MGPRIAAALLIVLVTATVVGVARGAAHPVILAAAGSTTWALLFAWRAAVSRVGGANLWPIAFAMLVLPAAIGGPPLVAGIVEAVRRRRLRR